MSNSHLSNAPYAASAQNEMPQEFVGPAARHVNSMENGADKGLKKPNKQFIAKIIMIILIAVVLVGPSPYVSEFPGPTQDVLGTVEDKPVINITGAKVYRSTKQGKLLLTTVSIAGVPGSSLSGIETFSNWLDPNATVIPQEVVFPPGQTREEFDEDNKKEMTGSQDAAAKQALRFLSAKGVNTSGIKISMHVDDIGGPSAGLMYTLGAIDKLTEIDETGGQVIAGTGTMESDGSVGKIGGIRLKMLGAKESGATWFFAPADNCDQVVGNVPSGLRDVKVGTLNEAYEALLLIGQGKGNSLPHCTVDSVGLVAKR